MAPPASRRSEESPLTGCGLPAAMCTVPSTPKASVTQPTTCRPAGPLLSGSRRLRQPTQTSIRGTSQPTLPTEPATIVRMASIRPPGSCHQTAAATTTARPNRDSPRPSRRCSGSISRAVCPILRATAPTAWAMPTQIAAIPRPNAPNRRRTGPPPQRTAPGPGRRLRALLRERVLALFFVVLRDRVEGLLLLREPGGEDVRVAMVTNLSHRHSSHTHHTPGLGPPLQQAAEVLRLPEMGVHLVHHADEPGPEGHRRVPRLVDDPIEVVRLDRGDVRRAAGRDRLVVAGQELAADAHLADVAR